MDIHDIRRLLPHRYPFLLIDRVVEYTPGESIVAVKNVTINEPFFNGHFPTRPVMPGVLVLEAMAQATGILAALTHGQSDDGINYLAGVDRARFKQPVVPGDQLRMTVSLGRYRSGVLRSQARAEVDGKVVAQAEFMSAVVTGESDSAS